MSETSVSIVNKALRRLGEGDIRTLDPDNINTDIEAKAAELYPMIRDTCLSLYDWRFAQKEQELSQDASVTPHWSWAYAYHLPPDMEQGPDAVYFDKSEFPTTNYQIINERLQCNARQVHVEYTFTPDESKWPAYFVQFVVTAIAAELALPVTEKVEKYERIKQEAWGNPSDGRMGGWAGTAMWLDSKSKPAGGLLQNGDPLTATRY